MDQIVWSWNDRLGVAMLSEVSGMVVGADLGWDWLVQSPGAPDRGGWRILRDDAQRDAESAMRQIQNRHNPAAKARDQS